MYARLSHGGVEQGRTLSLSPGLAWVLLMPRYRVFDSRIPLFNAAWTADEPTRPIVWTIAQSKSAMSGSYPYDGFPRGRLCPAGLRRLGVRSGHMK